MLNGKVMEAKIYGSLTRPAVLIVGTWDPFVENYFLLLEHLNQYCQSAGFDALPILLEPSPQHLLHNAVLPIYDSPAMRLAQLRSKVKGAVGVFSMAESELGDGVEDFMEVFFKQQVKIAELWLYEGQTMGRGGKSNIAILTETCAEIGIKVKTIPGVLNFKGVAPEAKPLLGSGRVEEATKMVGHVPLWQKGDDANENMPIGWKSGLYEYCPVKMLPDMGVELTGQPGKLTIYLNNNGATAFDWPCQGQDVIAITKMLE